MQTLATTTEIVDWCSRLRDAWRQAPEGVDLSAILLDAMAGEMYPPRPDWADSVTLGTASYPELAITYSTAVEVGDVRVTAEQTTFAYLDVVTYPNGTQIAGDIDVEPVTICISPAETELTVASAQNLIAAAGQLFIRLGVGGEQPPAITFGRRDTAGTTE
jgi:hypothetical protein